MNLYTYDYLERNGRLGNQLWQIAWQYGSAIKNDGRLYIKPDWEYRKFFCVPDSFFERPITHLSAVDGQTEYFQELHWWNGYEDGIKFMFSPSDYALEEVKRTTPVVSPADSCSIHYRRGDYVKLPQHYPIPSENYYKNAMVEILKENADTTFFVFSDDIDYIEQVYHKDSGLYKELLDHNKVHFVKGTPRPVEVIDRIGEPQDWLDLFYMSSCNYHIIANSTFSWWGAFLGESKTTYYPSVWFGNHESVRYIPWRQGIPDYWKEGNAL